MGAATLNRHAQYYNDTLWGFLDGLLHFTIANVNALHPIRPSPQSVPQIRAIALAPPIECPRTWVLSFKKCI